MRLPSSAGVAGRCESPHWAQNLFLLPFKCIVIVRHLWLLFCEVSVQYCTPDYPRFLLLSRTWCLDQPLIPPSPPVLFPVTDRLNTELANPERCPELGELQFCLASPPLRKSCKGGTSCDGPRNSGKILLCKLPQLSHFYAGTWTV